MKNVKQILALLLAAASGCSEGAPFSGPDRLAGDETVYHDMIVLGDRLEDPYSLDNMTRALYSVYPSREGRTELEPTHYYIRFLPGNSAELESFDALGFDYLDHPLDYSIVREGDYYHDPSVPEGEITWQYATVPVDAQLPVWLDFEIIDECYLPDTGPALRSGADGIDWDAVEAEAYRITGNASGAALVRAASPAGPEGRITISDPLYDEEPLGVAGVKVSCNSFVKFASCYTDDEGYYRMEKTFSNRPRYRLVFSNEKGFGIGMNLILVPASVSTLGKGDPGGMSVNVTKDSDRSLFSRCVVNNAAYDYWNFCSASSPKLKAPPANLRLWLLRSAGTSATLMLQQGALVDGSVVQDYLGEYTRLLKMFLPDVTLALKGRDDYASIYAEAIHALAHTSHYMQVGNAYWNRLLSNNLTSYVSSSFSLYGSGTEADRGYTEVAEMWAYYIQNKVYRTRYEDSNAAFGLSWWFRPQIFLYMDERGLDHTRIFPALTSDIVDADILQEKLLYLYPEYKSTILQAFMRYE